MGLLTRAEQQQLVDLLCRLPNIDGEATRRALLRGLPTSVRQTVPFSGVPRTDVKTIVDALDAEGARLGDGGWPILLVIEEALDQARELQLEHELQALLDTLQARSSLPAPPRPTGPGPLPGSRRRLALFSLIGSLLVIIPVLLVVGSGYFADLPASPTPTRPPATGSAAGSPTPGSPPATEALPSPTSETASAAKITITEFTFTPAGPSNADNVICRACTNGCGGVNVTLRVLVNTATDGSAGGEWKPIKELGVPCFNEFDAPRWETLEYAEGVHRVRLEAIDCEGNQVTREELYTLQPGRPSRPFLISPAAETILTSRTVTFRWQAALRATSYTLIVGTTHDPEDAPILNTLVTDTTHTATFAQDYPQLYWRVYANNDHGRTEQGGRSFSISRPAP